MTVAASATLVISTEAKRSGEISLLNSPGSIGVGDLSTQSIMGAVLVCPPYRHAAPLEMTMAAGAIGHTCGVRVDGPWTRPFGREGSEGSKGSEGSGGGGGGFAAGCVEGLCSLRSGAGASTGLRMVAADALRLKGDAAGAEFGRLDGEKKPLISRSFFISAEIRIRSSGIRLRDRRSLVLVP